MTLPNGGAAYSLDQFAEDLRKRKAVAASVENSLADFKATALRAYAPASLADDAKGAVDALAKAMRAEVEARNQVRSAKAEAEEAKTIALLNAAIDGKNEDARKAQREQALRSNTEYLTALRRIGDAEMREAQAGNDARIAQSRLDIAKALLRNNTAVLEFLAS
jgi:hypothetical protein